MSLLGFRSEDGEEDEDGTSWSRSTAPARRPRWRGLVAIALALAVVVVGGLVVYRVASGLVDRGEPQLTDFAGPGTTAVRFRVEAGASTRTIARELADAGVVATPDAFLAAAATSPDAATIQPGTYAVRREMSGAAALAALLDSGKRLGQVSIPEGSTVAATLKLVSDRSGIPVASLQAAAAALPRGPVAAPYRAGSPEGFLFPSTYDVQPNTPPAQVLTAMAERYRAAAAAVGLPARAKALGMSPYQVLVVASLVQAEVNDPADQAKVARVVYNRLRAGTPLELDSTVHYVTGRRGSVFTSAAERAVASPYNTYRVKGLPPTPIDSPAREALAAAAAPTPGPWLYYVTVDLDTGRTLFAATLPEHQANVAQLQVWCTAHKGRC